MKVVVREMDQIRALGANFRGDTQCFRNAQVRRMLGAKKRVDHKHASAPKSIDGVRWNGLRVCHVRQRTDAISKHRHRAVRNGHRHDLDVADDKCHVGLDDMSSTFWLGRARNRSTIIEDVGELAA